MSDFKVGDKVRVTGTLLFARWAKGLEGTIQRIHDGKVSLNFSGDRCDYGYISEIERVTVAEEKHKTLAEKLNALDALTAEIRAMVGLTPSGSAL